MKDVGKRVANRRRNLNITQTELADAIGVKQQTIQAIERGTTKASRHLPEIAKVLRCTYEWLKTGGGEEPEPQKVSLDKIPRDLADEIIRDAGYDPTQLMMLLEFIQENFPELESQLPRERYLRLVITAAKGQKTESGLPGADWIAPTPFITSNGVVGLVIFNK